MTALPLKIGDLTISRDSEPVVVAEAGLDHGGDHLRLFDLIYAAKEAGAKIFKTQHYHVDDLVGSASPEWYDRMKKRQISDENIAHAKDKVEQDGMIFLCTPHTDRALNFLVNDLQVKLLKIGSGEVGNWPFIEKAADTGIPLIVSTGMYNQSQLSHLIHILREARSPCAILHCVTAYPAALKDANLRAVEVLGRFWPGVYGYSDHTKGTLACCISTVFGVTVIEKHITLALPGPLQSQDREGAVDAPIGLKFLIRDISDTYKILGNGPKVVTSSEFKSMAWATKSITTLRDIEEGEIITPEVLCVRRPGGGLTGGEAYKVLGKTAQVDISAGAFIIPEMLK